MIMGQLPKIEYPCLHIQNHTRGICVNISGKDAAEAHEIYKECASRGMEFEWGDMRIETRNKDWKFAFLE
jgi:hypothetical protein